MPASGLSGVCHKIDEPAGWFSSSADGEARLAGWFFDAQGRPAKQVRVLLGNRVVHATAVPRPEVVKAHAEVFAGPASARGQNIGFHAVFTTRPGWKYLRVEAVDAAGLTWDVGRRLMLVRQGGAPRDDYADWIRYYDTLTEADTEAMRQISAAWPNPPKFEVLVLPANATEAQQRATADSVRGQIYPPRQLQNPNGNTVEDAGDQSFLVLITAGAKLRPHALFMLAAALQESPDAMLFYADDDEIQADGRRHDPDFKPEANPALLLGKNYLGDFITVRRDCCETLGQNDEKLSVRTLAEIVPALAKIIPVERMAHIPHVLCHRRAAASIATKPAPIKFPLAQPAPRISLVIPSACNLKFLAPCLKGLREDTDYPDLEILLAVNAIRDQDPAKREFLANTVKDPRVRVLRYPDQPFNISWVLNWAERQATGSLLGILNDDLEIIHRDWLAQLAGWLQQEGVGAVSPMLYYPNDTIQHAGVVLGVGGLADHTGRGLPRGATGDFGRLALARDVSAATGACLLLRREIYTQVGGFEEFLPVNFNDVDFCLKIRAAGWRIVWTPGVELYHHESVSLGKDGPKKRVEANRKEANWMRERWGNVLTNDPFYSPNLSLTRGPNGKLAFPPRVKKPWATVDA